MASRSILGRIKRNWEISIGLFILAYYVLTHIILDVAHVHHDTGLSNHLKVVPQEVIDHWHKSSHLDQHDTSKFAYVQYATGYDYLNLAIMNFITLRKSNTVIPNLVVLYDKELSHYHSDHWNNLYRLAVEHDIRLKPVSVIESPNKDSSTWAVSFTKFHVFNQVEYDRIVYFDSDSMFSQVNGEWQNIDELFSIPHEITYAAPQAYWLNNVIENKDRKFHKYHSKVDVPEQKVTKFKTKILVNSLNDPHTDFAKLPTLIYEHHKYDNRDDFFANHVMVLTPSRKAFNDLKAYLHNPWSWYLFQRSKLKKSSEYDMEILNKYLDDQLRNAKKSGLNVAILPHRTYGVLTGEFKERWHRRFVVDPQYVPFINKYSNDEWSASQAAKDAKLVHFSDDPIPKPWEHQNTHDYYNEYKIYCAESARDDPEFFTSMYPSKHKPRLVDDCDAVEIWEGYRSKFNALQHQYWVV